jgi:hypothetical protein
MINLDEIKKRHRAAEVAVKNRASDGPGPYTPECFVRLVVDAARLIDEVERLRRELALLPPLETISRLGGGPLA